MFIGLSEHQHNVCLHPQFTSQSVLKSQESTIPLGTLSEMWAEASELLSQESGITPAPGNARIHPTTFVVIQLVDICVLVIVFSG